MNELKEKFELLDQREKILLVIAVISVLFLVLYLLIWQPINDKKQRLDRQWSKANSDLMWIQENGARLQRLKGGGTSRASGNISSILNRAAVSSKMSMKRFKPKANNEAQVWFEQVSYNKLLDWFKIVEQDNGLTLKKVTISSAVEKNIVDVSVVVSQGG